MAACTAPAASSTIATTAAILATDFTLIIANLLYAMLVTKEKGRSPVLPRRSP
jgi:hypothetical protein